VNSEKARSRIESSSAGKNEYGAKKMSELLGAFGFLDFTMLRLVLA
jgi:hypothetical protein